MISSKVYKILVFLAFEKLDLATYYKNTAKNAKPNPSFFG